MGVEGEGSGTETGASHQGRASHEWDEDGEGGGADGPDPPPLGPGQAAAIWLSRLKELDPLAFFEEDGKEARKALLARPWIAALGLRGGTLRQDARAAQGALRRLYADNGADGISVRLKGATVTTAVFCAANYAAAIGLALGGRPLVWLQREAAAAAGRNEAAGADTCIDEASAALDAWGGDEDDGADEAEP